MRRLLLASVALAAGLSACSGSGSSPTSPSHPASSPNHPASSPRTTSSVVAGPSLPALPSDRATADPCAFASSPFTAASTYLGLAELGRTDEAQRCVSGVPDVTTAGLTAASPAGYFVPTGDPSGMSLGFHQVEGTRSVTVTVSLVDSHYVVSAVR